jgi:hypothetical protein
MVAGDLYPSLADGGQPVLARLDAAPSAPVAADGRAPAEGSWVAARVAARVLAVAKP